MFPRQEIKANARAALSANYWPVVGYPFLLGVVLSAVLSTIFSIVMVLLIGSVGLTALSGSAVAVVGGVGFAIVLYIVVIVAVLLFSNVIYAGRNYFFYKFYSGDTASFGTFFEGFKNGQMWHVIGGMLLMTLYILLWTWLLVIPGSVLMGVGVAFYDNVGLMIVIMLGGFVLYIAGLVFAFAKSYQYSMIPYLLIDRPDLTVSGCFDMTKQLTAGNKFNLFVLDLSFIGWGILSAFTCGILSIFYVGPYFSLAKAGAYDYLKRTRMV